MFKNKQDNDLRVHVDLHARQVSFGRVAVKAGCRKASQPAVPLCQQERVRAGAGGNDLLPLRL